MGVVHMEMGVMQMEVGVAVRGRCGPDGEGCDSGVVQMEVAMVHEKLGVAINRGSCDSKEGGCAVWSGVQVLVEWAQVCSDGTDDIGQLLQYLEGR